MPIAEINGHAIHYEDVGEGTPILLGHSFLCTGDLVRAVHWRHGRDACGANRSRTRQPRIMNSSG